MLASPCAVRPPPPATATRRKRRTSSRRRPLPKATTTTTRTKAAAAAAVNRTRRRHAVLAGVFAKCVTALLFLSLTASSSTGPILVVEARAPPHCASACGHTCGFVGTAAAAAASSHRRRQPRQRQQGDAQRFSLGNVKAIAATKSAAAASSSSPEDEDGCVGRGGNDDAA
jgi:hypothetical protein